MDRETEDLVRRLGNRLRKSERQVSTSKTMIAALLLLLIGLSSIFFVNTNSDETLHHIVRDLGIAALISGFLGVAYDSLIRGAFSSYIRDEIETIIDNHCKQLRVDFNTD